MENHSSKKHFSQITQIWAATTLSVTLFEVYMNFKKVFFAANTGHLPLNKDHWNAIDLVDNKEPPYRLIHSLSKNEMSILRVYIDKPLTNRFIETSKSSAYILIPFVVKVEVFDCFYTAKVSTIWLSRTGILFLYLTNL